MGFLPSFPPKTLQFSGSLGPQMSLIHRTMFPLDPNNGAQLKPQTFHSENLKHFDAF